MGGSSGGGGSSKTVQNIPKELKPLAREYTHKALDLSKQEFDPYSAQRYADLNPYQLGSVDMTANRAMSGSQTFNNAESNLNQMMSGGPNPYLDAMVGRAQDQVIKGYNQANVGSGSFGNSGLQEALARGLGDVSTNMYGQAYDSDQARRMQAIGMAPGFADQAYKDAGQLMQAGQTLQDQAQQNKDFSYEEFMRQKNLPYQQLAAMSGVFGSNLGQSSTTTQKTSGGGK